MNTGYLPKLKLSAIVVAAFAACLLAVPATNTIALASATSAEAETQDLLHMRDGRILTGKIIVETATQVVFRYVDRNLNLETQLTLNKADILQIERDKPMETQPARSAPRDSEPADDFDRSASPRERGMAEGDADDESLPAFYVIPMKGQMGTDVHPDPYRSIISDIRAQNPAVVVWVLNCADFEDKVLPPDSLLEVGLYMFDEYRELVRMLHDELRGIQQVMWVEDAFGIGAVMALAWEEMYMQPGARLVGMERFWLYVESITDPEVLAKNREAVFGFGNAFLERGGRSIVLGHALMNPEAVLSASWRGRDVLWRLDLDGEYIVNASRRYTPTFRAKTAEDFGISKGTAESLDDLAMLLGYREYRVLDGRAPQAVERYVQQWRREFENAQRLLRDHQQHMSWATGDQVLMWLGRAKADLERVIQAMHRFPAVEYRLRMQGGPSKFQLEMQVERINERIRGMRQRERDRGPGRGGGGGGAGGGGRR